MRISGVCILLLAASCFAGQTPTSKEFVEIATSSKQASWVELGHIYTNTKTLYSPKSDSGVTELMSYFDKKYPAPKARQFFWLGKDQTGKDGMGIWVRKAFMPQIRDEFVSVAKKVHARVRWAPFNHVRRAS